MTSELALRCEREVLELHIFYERWLTGELPPTEENYSRLTSVLSSDFALISPSGEIQTAADLIPQLKMAHGLRRNSEFTFHIMIKNFDCRFARSRMALVTYEEWHEFKGKINARLSSAIFRPKAGTPNGLEWLHVHEVWLPLH